MRKILNKLHDVLAAIAVFLFALIFIISIADIVCRTFFGISLLWKLDFLQIVVCWMLSCSMSAVVLTRDHLRIDFLKVVLPKKSQDVLTLITDLLELAFFVMLIPYGIKTSITKMKIAFTTLRWPMGYMYLNPSYCRIYHLLSIDCASYNHATFYTFVHMLENLLYPRYHFHSHERHHCI